MTEDERKLIMAMVKLPQPASTKSPAREEFLRRFRASTDGQKLSHELLIEAIESQDPTDVELSLVVGFIFGFTEQHLSVLLSLAPAPWHISHEDVISALGSLKTPKAVEALRGATKWIPDYLDYDENRALAVKAIWALGSIEGLEAEAALSELMHDPDPILASNATKQMKRRRK